MFKDSVFLQLIIFWVLLVISFVFGLFIGKNNPNTIQKLGEEGEAEIGAIVKKIKDKKP